MTGRLCRLIECSADYFELESLLATRVALRLNWPTINCSRIRKKLLLVFLAFNKNILAIGNYHTFITMCSVSLAFQVARPKKHRSSRRVEIPSPALDRTIPVSLL